MRGMIGSRTQLGPDPTAVLGRYLDRQKREDQFSEDIRKVVHGGGQAGGSTSSGRGARSNSAGGAGRTRSPGLAAGAALALGGGNAAEVHAEAHTQRQQAVEYARRRECPFDDHTAFGAGASDREKPQRLGSPLVSDEGAAAHQAAHTLGQHNRDMHQKIGAGAPFDAPELSLPKSSSNAASSESVWRTESFAEAQAQAAANKSRMKGAQDLIAGNYWGVERTMARRSGSLPPRGPMAASGTPPAQEWQAARASLLPQAAVKLQYDGGNASTLRMGRAEYLNSQVLAESNRDRNRGGIQLG